MMKSRKLAIGLLLMLAVVVTTGSFAYWASSVTVTDNTSNATVTIGTGQAVTTTMSLGAVGTTSGANITPVGQAGDDAMVFTVDVTWTDPGSIEGTTGTLSVSEEYQDMGTLDDSDLDAMFTTTYSFTPAIAIGGTATVTITVTFTNEPASEAIYDIVVANDLVLDLTFEIAVD